MIIVGLGNPGLKYKGTYHNAGYGVVDALAKKLGKKINKIECNSLTAVTSVNGEKIVLAKPTTYMNNSGEGVKSLSVKYADCGQIIIVYDDIDIDRFSVRVRAKGSGGTHNGMRDVVAKMNTEDLIRIRVGIGKPLGDLRDYVLDKPTKQDMKTFEITFDKCADLLLDYIKNGDFDKLMREGNSIK